MEGEEGKRNHVFTLIFSSTLKLETKNFECKDLMAKYKLLDFHICQARLRFSLNSKPKLKPLKSIKLDQSPYTWSRNN